MVGLVRCIFGGARKGNADTAHGGETRGKDERGVRPLGRMARDETAQGTLEYALTLFALMALVAGIAAIWKAGADGTLADLVRDAASHALSGTGPIDISLY